ncbi:hypothetical protein L1887_43289 [Cichorium endivia]|nr:hypothetical protein L1887_43289 [Cichorium endivia]
MLATSVLACVIDIHAACVGSASCALPCGCELTRSLEVLRVSVNEGSGVDVTNAVVGTQWKWLGSACLQERRWFAATVEQHRRTISWPIRRCKAVESSTERLARVTFTTNSATSVPERKGSTGNDDGAGVRSFVCMLSLSEPSRVHHLEHAFAARRDTSCCTWCRDVRVTGSMTPQSAASDVLVCILSVSDMLSRSCQALLGDRNVDSWFLLAECVEFDAGDLR